MKYAFFLLALIAAASATADIMNEFEEDSTQESLIEETEEPQEPQEENKMIATEGEEEVAEAKETPPEEPQEVTTEEPEAAVATEEPQVAVATEEPQAVDFAVNAAGARFININALNAQINKVIESKIKKEPVIQLLELAQDGHKRLSIKKVNPGSLKVERVIETISIGHGRASRTGRYLAYRPRFSGYHRTRFGTLFLNLDKLFPCANRIRPFCRRFTQEEDGFRRGKEIIEAADRGNNFKMFGRANVYGMAFKGCCYLNGYNGCLPRYFETTIACFLPKSCA